MAGEARIVIVMHCGTGITPEGVETYTGPIELPQVVEIKQAGDFEAVSEWVGMRDQACHRVEVRESSARLLIDVQHPQG